MPEQENYRILVVDDDLVIQRTMEGILGREGYSATTVGSIAEAEKELFAGRFDLMLCDINLPDGSGLDLIASAAVSLPTMAVVMLSVINDVAIATKALHLGVDGYVTKPFDVSQVLISVVNGIRHRRLQLQQKAHTIELERKVESRTRHLNEIILQLQSTQDKLRATSNLYRGLFDNTKTGIAICRPVDEGGSFVLVDYNPAALGMDRVKKDAVIDKRIEEVFPMVTDLGILDCIRDVHCTGKPQRCRVSFQRKSGGTEWREYSFFQLAEGEIVAFYSDETERESAIRSLREERHFLKNLLESIPNPIFYKNTGGVYVGCNTAFTDFLGKKRDEIVGKTVWDIAPEHLAGVYHASDAGLLNAPGTRTYEVPVHHEDGTFHDVIMTKTTYRNSNGELDGLVGVIVDISDRKRMEARLIRKHKALEKAKSKLEEKNEHLRKAHENLKRAQLQNLQQEKMASIGQLAAGIAHEINNPTGFVSSNLKTLKDYLKDLVGLIRRYRRLVDYLVDRDMEIEKSPLDEMIAHIRRDESEMDLEYVISDTSALIGESEEGTERIKKIVMDLKDFAHPGQNERVTGDINQYLDSVLNIAWSELKYKADVVKDYGDIPEVSCYPQQLNQVFMNLLVNAAQAIENQGKIRIRTRRAGSEHVEVRISDTGCGIPPDQLNRIFDPFFTTKPVGKGTGLGLHVAYNIIKKHGGDIRVDSEVGRGTEFLIRLPLRHREEDPGV